MGNNVTKRPYRILSDFGKVYAFLEKNYSLNELNGMMLPQFFEYAHTHPNFDKDMTHRMTVWEENGDIVAFCGYETELGEAYTITDKAHGYLLPELIKQAEKELARTENGFSLDVWAISTQHDLITLLDKNGYKRVYSEPVLIYKYENGFPSVSLPDGFSCIDLSGEIDLYKLNRCTWRGFNHGDDVEYEIDSKRYMANAPHYRGDLGRVVIAPDGEYACYAGMWLDEVNRYAYLEPLCTVPEYRRMGLARYALVDAMKQTVSLGAEYCFGGSDIFYKILGFGEISQRILMKKVSGS